MSLFPHRNAEWNLSDRELGAPLSTLFSQRMRGALMAILLAAASRELMIRVVLSG